MASQVNSAVANMRNILVTGAEGFIGRNVVVRLRELPRFAVSEYVRGESLVSLEEKISNADVVIHLAGENRPKDEAAFHLVNSALTHDVCKFIQQANRPILLILASSAQAEMDNPYGRSKLAAERFVKTLETLPACSAVIYRLPGVFGKWCKPFYNSVVATFCHSVSRNIALQVRDPAAEVRLVYVDDVVAEFISAIDHPQMGVQHGNVQPEYLVTLGELVTQLNAFKDTRKNLLTARVGEGFTRALYATYVSYLPPSEFAYDIPQHSDARGTFVEMLKTPDCGQFSFFSAKPGVTRGGHYHHTKTEKFLVLRSEARFRFRSLATGEVVEITTSASRPQIVDTIPGWVHDITNTGSEDMLVMLWANENFDRTNPDTVAQKVLP